MREKDLNVLLMFTLRTAMYTSKVSEGRISSFLHGYELGSDGECRFIEAVSNSVKLAYNIDVHATGWIGQLGQLAEKQKMDWISTFKKQSLKLLVAEFEKQESTEYRTHIKRVILGRVKGIENWLGRDWISDWFGFVDLSATWFRDLWSEQELLLIYKIEEELTLYGNPTSFSDKIEPSADLLLLCEKLYN